MRWSGSGSAEVKFALPFFGNKVQFQLLPSLKSHLIFPLYPIHWEHLSGCSFLHAWGCYVTAEYSHICFIFKMKTLQLGQRVLNLPEPNKTHISDYHHGKVVLRLQKGSWIQSNEFGFFFLRCCDLAHEEGSGEQKADLANGSLMVPSETENILGLLQDLWVSETGTLRTSFSGSPSDSCFCWCNSGASYYGWPYFTVGKTLQTGSVSKWH